MHRRWTHAHWLTIATLALFAAARGVFAQERAQIAVVGGTATDQVGVRSNAVTVAPNVWFAPAANASLSLGASATRFQNDAWSLGAATSFSARERIAGPLSFSLDASATAARLAASTPATFASAEVTPALQADAGRFTVFAGMRLASGFASTDATGPTLPGVGAPRPGRRRSVGGSGPTFGAGFLAAARPDAALRVSAREDRLRIAGADIVDRTLSATFASRAMVLGGSAGQRKSGDENTTFGSAALSLALREDLALDIAAGRYASNPLMGIPGGNYLNAGFSFRLGAHGTESMRQPRVAGAPAVRAGYQRLVLEAPDARRVEVAGDFNNWKPVAATRAPGGMWYADLRIAPGQYRYAFRVDGTDWRVPHGVTAVDDGFGGKAAWLVVTVDDSGH